jgi:adenosylcobinamide-GDP ribazoletransferase
VREALALLTTLGGSAPLTARALRWFPAVGLALGAALGAIWWGTERIWAPGLAAALVVAADLALTGMLHLDGLADSADGLLPHASRERRLEIMRAPDVGAFALGTVGAVLLLRVAALASIAPEPVVLAAIWCSSRAVVASVPAVVPYARAGGLATPLVDGAPTWPAFAIVPAAVVAAAGAGVLGACAVAMCALAAITVVAFGRARLGGFTGDVLGAAIVVGETAALVVLAVSS